MINGREHPPEAADASGVLPSYAPAMSHDATITAGHRQPPPQVVSAVRVMLVNVGILVISTVVTLTTKSHLRSVIAHRHPEYTSSHLDTLVNAAVISGVVFGLIFAAAYAWLAFRVRAGRNWARITTFVLAGLGILSGVSGLASNNRTTPSVLLNLLSLVLNGSVVVLLARKPSNEYFRGTSTL